MALLGSESELPIIDFSEEAMKPGTTTWDLTREHVQKALEEYGCFEATFSEINNTDQLYSSLEKLFDLPKDTKRRFTSDGPLSLKLGYISDFQKIPLYEAMALSDPLNFQTVHNLSLCMWPQGDATFCETLHSHVTRASKLEEIVRKMIFQSYGVEERLFEVESQSMEYILRLLKYEAPMTDETALGLHAHYDKSSLTVLLTDGVGLQVQNKDGEWISSTPSGSSLIVMIGESFHGWSNGRLRCPLHKVKMSGFKSRYSMVLFSNKRGIVEIPSEMIDEQHPLLFRPFDYLGLFEVLGLQNMSNDDNIIVPVLTTHFAI